MAQSRQVVLALLLGIVALATSPVMAQSGAYAPPGGGYPGPYMMDGNPYACPPGDAWYGGWEEVDNIADPRAKRVWLDGGFVRLEYLNWNLRRPGNELLGAPTLTKRDPSVPFNVFFPNTNVPIAVATIPNLDPIQLRNNNGLRLTGGLDFFDGNGIELSAFMLEKANSGFTLSNFGSTNPVGLGLPVSVPITVGTSTLVNGQLSDNIELYNESFRAFYESQIWGAEGNILFDLATDGLFHVRPMIGGRYISLDEKLQQRGVFRDFVSGQPDVNTEIDSNTKNSLGGGQIGLRTEFVTKWFELGGDAKLAFLGNSMIANVRTNRFRSNLDPVVVTQDTLDAFTLGVDVGGWVGVNLTRNFSLRAGYSFLWLNRVTRPEDNIFYNDNGPLPTPPGVVAKLVKSDFAVYGFNIGGEFRY
jgi:hypothetical protein